MKQGYSNRQVKDICTKGSSQVAQKNLEGLTGDYPIYGASGLIKNVDFYHQEKEYIGLVKDGSGIGRVMFLPPKSSVIGTLQYILPKEGYNIRYIGYCLQSLRLDKYKQGAAIPHIYFKDYGEAQILVADNPDEQQRIVALLDAEFAKIDALKANAEKNLQNAKDLFQAALKKELEPKEGWDKKQLGDIAEFKNGLNFGKEHGCRKYHFLGVGDFKENTMVETNKLNYIYQDGIDPDYYLKDNDIVFVRSNGSRHLVGRSMLIKSGNEPSVFSGFCIRCRFISSIVLPQFAMRFFSLDTTKRILTSSGGGCNISNLNQKVLSALKIPFPTSIDEQANIVSRIEQMESHCKTLQANYEKTLSLCDDLKQ
ncbi:MAG: restriction endonuclease subunit S, partial [Bacteroidales bacterium]|nr:restriction endonuclease subunit S [Bacteroidales bacterium]